MYGSNEIYWGLGIEEETYLQFTKPIHVAAPILRTRHAAERYSVKYYTTYKDSYKQAIAALFPDASGCIPLPFFVNANAFTRMDIHGNHKTTYEKVPKPNPAFSGKTFFQSLEETDSCLQRPFTKIFYKNCIFDGDSLEFMTQNFYKGNVRSAIKELVGAKKDLLKVINAYLIENRLHRDKGLLMYPINNP